MFNVNFETQFSEDFMKPITHRFSSKLALLLSLIVFSLTSFNAHATDNCFDLVNRFIDSEQAQTSVPAGSLIEQNPEIAPLLNKMIPPALDFPTFILEFQRQTQRTPTLRETIEFVYESRRELHQAYDDLIETLSNLENPFQRDFLIEIEQTRYKLSKFKNLDSLEDEVRQSFSEGKSRVESLDIPIPIRDENGQTFFDEDYYRFLKDRTGLTNYSGEIGELLVYAQTPERILAKGLRFDIQEQVVEGYQSEIRQDRKSVV